MMLRCLQRSKIISKTGRKSQEDKELEALDLESTAGGRGGGGG
jgi:hypothetical protein